MAAVIQVNMTRGEITPLLHARIDLDHYKGGMARMLNWVALRFGGATRMPGSLYYGDAKFANRYSRGLPFQFKRSQTYRLEFGHLYVRFWNINGRVEDPPGTPVEVVTPFTEDDLRFIQLRQIGDLVYLVCGGHFPQVLTRFSETNWTLTQYAPVDGPYLDINTTAYTLDPSAASGAVTLTLSDALAINGGAGWQASDVGLPVRYLEAGGRWYWFRITGWVSATVVNATYMGRDDGDLTAMPGHAATVNFRVSAWSDYQGYPSAIGLNEDRLIFAGTERQPTTAWTTIPGATGYADFSVSTPLADDDAVTARLTGGQLNGVQWIADGTDILLGTEGSLRVLGRANENAAFGPKNLRQRNETAVPTSFIPGFLIESVLIFLDVYRSQLYEAIYSNESQSYVARELSALNEHLFAYGITSIAYQASPFKILWMTTDDGSLLAVTYDRGQEVFGVSQCNLGEGVYVEDALSLPGTTADGDQVWFGVRRTIGGGEKRTVELLSAFFRAGISEQALPVYGHCAGVYNGPETDSIVDLDHLEGDTVGVWADGIDVGNVVITDGVLTLPVVKPTASKIVWGLRYSSLMRTLRLAEYGTGESGLGRQVNVSEGLLDLYQTVQLRAGTGARTVADYDEGLDYVRWDDDSEQNPYEELVLRTGSVPAKFDDSWENCGVITIETNSMHQATVRAITVFPEGED